MPRPLSRIKRWLVPSRREARRVWGGVFRGITLELDLADQSQLYVGLFEREVQGWLRRFSRNVRAVMDVGADQGEYTLFALCRTNARRVLAFEPSDTSRERMRRNLHLNGMESDPRLRIVPAFVGSMEKGNWRTLNSFLAEIDGPCLVKIDVDGGEAEVLRGATTLVARRDVCWIIETHSAELERECVAILQRAGLRTLIVPNAWWRRFVPELRPIAHNRWLVAFDASRAGSER
jgi:hypothetical protein